MIQKRTLLATLLLTVMWSQTAFDQSKAAAEIILAEDLNSLRKSLSEAGYDVRFQNPPMEGQLDYNCCHNLWMHLCNYTYFFQTLHLKQYSSLN